MNLRHRIGESDKNDGASCSSYSSQHTTRTTTTSTTITTGGGFLVSSFGHGVVSSLSKKRRCCQKTMAFQKCKFYVFLLVMVGSWFCWYYYSHDILNGDVYYYYHTNNDNTYSLSDWLATRATTTLANFTSLAAARQPRRQGGDGQNITLHELPSSSSSSKLNVDSDFYHHHQCAILFYGLPRSFRLLVLPSVIRNIIRPNARYQCDYFVHYYHVQEQHEAPSRSGYGGFINTSEILLLKQAVEEEQHQQETDAIINDASRTRRTSSVHFTSDTNASFWQYQNGLHVDLMHQIRTTTGKRRFIKQHAMNYSTKLLYLPVKDATYTFQTLENILKMWHSQSSVYHLMQQYEQDQQAEYQPAASNNNTEQKNLHVNYTRVALFRSDVVYVTPINIWNRVNTAAAAAASNKDMVTGNDGEVGGHTQRQQQQDEPAPAVVLDVDNTQAVIPAFAKHPVNDRMFYGPAPAAKIWATQRLERLEKHVHERILKLEPGFGMHSERYLYYTIFPAIYNETNVEIVEDESICMLRARADESVWINDCDSSSTNKSSSNNSNTSRGTMEEYRAMIERMIGRSCQQSRLPKEIHTRVIQIRCGLNETKTTL